MEILNTCPRARARLLLSSRLRLILRRSLAMPRGVLRTANLPQLQNLIKRDPTAYKEEFLQQWNHYNSILHIFHLNPDEHAAQFRELVAFIAQVSTCYPKETAGFPAQVSSVLLDSYPVLFPDTRKALIQTLVLLRNKGVTTSIESV